MTRFSAPACPDCGSPCVHPLRTPVKCGRCSGTGRFEAHPDSGYEPCDDCNQTGKVQPPPPTDEQIFGRECERCSGKGGLYYEGSGQRSPCPDCNGTGWAVPPAENRWTCLGSKEWNLGELGTVKGARVICPGRTDIVADPSLWEEVKRAWRTRTKTTVLEGYRLNSSGIFLPPEASVYGHTPGSRTHLVDFVPDEDERRAGKWTIVITFEPEDEK